MHTKARYIMIGGFLGAGKTTAVARLARTLRGEGLRVGLITNDQGNQLVDTAMLSSQGFAVEEIAGGCFCCRFNSLTDAARKLSAETRPDVFIAEPVGSCTDLVATVSYPLRRIYGEQFTLAPLSVLIDPIRARRIFGLEAGGSFSEKVIYIYEKQLQEANVIVINKTDLLEVSRLAELRDALTARFPSKPVLEVSARHDRGLDEWFEIITGSEQGMTPAMTVDYALYGEGEALLGWLNATIQISAPTEIDANTLLADFAADLQTRLNTAAVEIAHLKMTLSPDDAFSDVAVINLVRSDATPELSQELPEPIERGELILNIRAETDPDQLRSVVNAAVEQMEVSRLGISFRLEHIESFRPGQPCPTHRIEQL
jgi:Ni2+-binding GTPase involved in maturation of urease and hydrogenase